MKKRIFLVIVVTLLLLFGLGGWAAADVMRNDDIQTVPSRPEERMDVHIEQLLYDLEEDNPLDFSVIPTTMDYIDGRYDCADFRLQSTIRIVYDYAEQIPAVHLADIKDTVLGFRYWMDQPGTDSMCFWSENHQLLFATAEYLFGHYYQDETFTNDGLSGADHREMGKERVLTWLEQRWLYGFTEFYSNTYYVEDIAPLANLVDFAPDEEVRVKAKIILDLLLYDVATQSFKGVFSSVSGRMYEEKKKHPEQNSMQAVLASMTDDGTDTGRRGMDLNFLYVGDYQIPDVLEDILLDEGPVIIKASNGLDLPELKGEDLVGLDDPQIMMQWGMEAFTNPEIITNSMRYIHRHDMLANEFLNDFKMIDITVLREGGLLPWVSRMLDPKTNGVAIQRGNAYTYKTPDYFMATLQNHHPGEFADQQHVFQVLLSREVAVFHQHPAQALGEGALSGSPGYWVGYGRFPHSVQHGNVNLSIYDLPDKTGFMEDDIFHFTHAYFPTQLFDDHEIDGRYAFARKGDAYIALIGKNDLYLGQEITDPDVTSTDDLIQDGPTTYWITEASCADEDGDFETFKTRIRENEITFDEDDLRLTYESDHLFDVVYRGDFSVDDAVVDLEYSRMDSPYAVVNRKPDTITISFNGVTLFLDFYGMERRETT